MCPCFLGQSQGKTSSSISSVIQTNLSNQARSSTALNRIIKTFNIAQFLRPDRNFRIYLGNQLGMALLYSEAREYIFPELPTETGENNTELSRADALDPRGATSAVDAKKNVIEENVEQGEWKVLVPPSLQSQTSISSAEFTALVTAACSESAPKTSDLKSQFVSRCRRSFKTDIKKLQKCPIRQRVQAELTEMATR